MNARQFINFYEVLEVPQNATRAAIDRKFRQFAGKYHPDNQETGDRIKFDAVVEAHATLKDADKRAAYHEQNQHNLPPLSQQTAEDPGPSAPDDGQAADEGAADDIGIERDISIQNMILTLLYQRRRRHIKEPGIGNIELERLSGCPHEHLEFHLWYLRGKGWIATEEDGRIAITMDGVDRAAAIYREGVNKLITDQS